MPLLKVTANRLNKRKAIPLHFPDPASIIGEVFKDASFEGFEVTESEIPNKALGKWFRDRDGHFYWGGGLSVSLREAPVTPAATLQALDYRTIFSFIPLEWTQTNGRNIKVAVLDTGFNIDHPDLVHLKNSITLADFGVNSNTNDQRGHGTHILGLLGARASGPDGITGLIPEAEFFSYKVIRDGVGILDMFVEAAILDAVDRGVDIINMSFDVPSSENSSLHAAIRKAIDKKILIVASAGENDNLIQGSLVFPSQFKDVISVGEVSIPFSQAVTVAFNNQLDLIMPLVEQRSCWINDSFGLYRNLKGSSMASALVTGILASNMSFTNKTADALGALKNIIPSFSNAIFNDAVLQIIKP